MYSILLYGVSRFSPLKSATCDLSKKQHAVWNAGIKLEQLSHLALRDDRQPDGLAQFRVGQELRLGNGLLGWGSVYGTDIRKED